MKSTFCNCCGKPLSDPVSIDFGIGPICRVKKKTIEQLERTGNLFSNRSDYSFGIDGPVLWIVDNNGPKSVTNDMENVLAELAKTNVLTNYRIMYKDSMGIWDGVKPNPVTFFPITETEYRKAKEKILAQ